MVIVNQNKTDFVNLDNVTRIFIEDFSKDEDGFGIGAYTNSAESNCWDLGYYKTEERAKEVLQEIISAYSDFKYYSTEEGKKRTEIGIRIFQKYRTLDIYEMPED